MPSVNAFATNFSAGELSPLLYARVDIGKYANSCQVIENFIVERYGGANKRGGSEHIAAVKTPSAKVWLVPFIFSQTQAYILEFGNEYIRIYTDGGQVQSGMSAVEVTTPYQTADLSQLQFAQSADVLYISHPDYAPRQFERTSATSFTLAEADFEDGPYLPLNITTTSMTPAGHGSATATMTGASAPSGTVSGTAPSGGNLWELFDKDGTGAIFWSGSQPSITYQFDSSAQLTVDKYYIKTTPGSGAATSSPVAWLLQGSNDGTNWTTVDSQTSQTGWTASEVRSYDVLNPAAFEYYKNVFQGSNGAAGIALGEIGYHLDVSDQTAFNLTASAVTGINNGDGFQATDVGRHIRLLASDGIWRWAIVQARSSTTVVTIKIYGIPLPNLDPILNWQLGAWSDESGWPACVGFYEGRLAFGRTAAQPQTVWFSKVDDFTDFGESDPLVDSDAINATISSESVNEIQWLAESTDLFVGTTAAIRTIGANTQTGGFSPTNIRQKRETTYGASPVQPVRVGNVGIYSGYYAKDLREIAFSFERDGYVSQDLSILAEHITSPGIVQITYQQTPASIVWFCDEDGSLAAMTYERDQDVVAFHRHILGGTDVSVESVAAIPGTTGDEVWLAVARTVDGGTVRYIERLSVGLDTDGAIEDATYLDSFLQYSGGSTTSITGLDHLEGETVYAYGAEGVQGPYTVSSGSITLGEAVTACTVGLKYTSALETLSPEAAARGGTAQTRLGHIAEVWLRLNRSQDGTIGPVGGDGQNVQELIEYDDDALFSGDKRVPLSMEWNRGRRLRIVHNEPTPFHLLGMVMETRVSG